MRRKLNKPVRILIAILAVIALVGGIIGWSLWRQHVTAEKQAQEQTKQSQQREKKTRKQKNTKPTALTDEQKQQHIDLATQFELKARTWGTDPGIDINGLSKQDAQTVVDSLRTPDFGANPLTDLIGFDLDANEGPDAPSVLCEQNLENGCSQYPTMKDWWRAEALASGSKWMDGPHVTINDNSTMHVTGTVRTILVQDTDTFNNGTYYAITPAWRDYQIDDTLTVENGKISRILSSGSNDWWLNPWLEHWNTRMADSLANGERKSIPVNGKPTMNLSHYGVAPMLKGPATQGDLDGKVDWSLWSDIPMQAPNSELDALTQECIAKYGDQCPYV